MISVTCKAPVNIAVIKYWGKRDEELILPLNDSLSATLSTDQLCAMTTITASPKFAANRIILNGKEEPFENRRLLACLAEVKRRSAEANARPAEMLAWNIQIVSENNFPTAAGLASSAAGYACLVYALAQLYNVQEQEISRIARVGSGSACRSVYGGFVRWMAGTRADGEDSMAVQVAPASHWPEMRVLILVVNDQRKKTSSTGGMARSVETSELLKYRVKHCVPRRVEEITQAILERNFKRFAEITMQDSNQFHGVCLDTYPPCVYMNDVSHAISNLIHAFNDASGEAKAAYTFDAGPNACLYLLEKDVPEVLGLVRHVFPSDQDDQEYFRGLSVDIQVPDNATMARYAPIDRNLLKYIIHTKVGEGPQLVKSESNL